MSLSRRLFDLARANLNALLDRATGETVVDELTDEELEAELVRRRERRLRDDEARRTREAAEQAARVRGAERRGKLDSPRPSEKRSSTRSKPRPVGTSAERRLRELYAQLEVPYGTPFEEVKHAFRRLMRKYHPDLHAGDPKKHEAASQLTKSLTQAYNELETILLGGPNRGR